MQPRITALLSVYNTPELASVLHLAGVANLATHFGIERRCIENDRDFVLHFDGFKNLCRSFEFLVADEFRRRRKSLCWR